MAFLLCSRLCMPWLETPLSAQLMPPLKFPVGAAAPPIHQQTSPPPDFRFRCLFMFSWEGGWPEATLTQEILLNGRNRLCSFHCTSSDHLVWNEACCWAVWACTPIIEHSHSWVSCFFWGGIMAISSEAFWNDTRSRSTRGAAIL